MAFSEYPNFKILSGMVGILRPNLIWPNVRKKMFYIVIEKRILRLIEQLIRKVKGQCNLEKIIGI